MPIPLPNLDDRTWSDLTDEARALLPVLYPGWTDHNPTDPGIALVELLAWLTEMALFGVNQIPPAHTWKFLQLLGGPSWSPTDGVPVAGPVLDAAVGQTLRALRERYRTVTAADYEHVMATAWPSSPEAAALGVAAGLQRVRCVPERDLTAADPAADAPAHVSLVVVPEADTERPQPDEALTAAILRFLDPRRLLTTRNHVTGPGYVDIGVAANLALHEDAPPADALAQAQALLTAFLDPLHGGPAGAGWPFGRAVYTSEVYAVLARAALVDFAEDVVLSGPRPVLDPDGQTIGIDLDAHELARLGRLDLVGYDSNGRTYPLNWTAAP